MTVRTRRRAGQCLPKCHSPGYLTDVSSADLTEAGIGGGAVPVIVRRGEASGRPEVSVAEEIAAEFSTADDNPFDRGPMFRRGEQPWRNSAAPVFGDGRDGPWWRR
jgi:hypothetical protein